MFAPTLKYIAVPFPQSSSLSLLRLMLKSKINSWCVFVCKYVRPARGSVPGGKEAGLDNTLKSESCTWISWLALQFISCFIKSLSECVEQRINLYKFTFLQTLKSQIAVFIVIHLSTYKSGDSDYITHLSSSHLIFCYTLIMSDLSYKLTDRKLSQLDLRDVNMRLKWL